MTFWRTQWTLSNGLPAALPGSTPNGRGWRESNATKSPATSGQINAGNKASPRWLSWNGCVRVFLHLWEATQHEPPLLPSHRNRPAVASGRHLARTQIPGRNLGLDVSCALACVRARARGRKSQEVLAWQSSSAGAVGSKSKRRNSSASIRSSICARKASRLSCGLPVITLDE